MQKKNRLTPMISIVLTALFVLASTSDAATTAGPLHVIVADAWSAEPTAVPPLPAGSSAAGPNSRTGTTPPGLLHRLWKYNGDDDEPITVDFDDIDVRFTGTPVAEGPGQLYDTNGAGSSAAGPNSRTGTTPPGLLHRLWKYNGDDDEPVRFEVRGDFITNVPVWDGVTNNNDDTIAEIATLPGTVTVPTDTIGSSSNIVNIS